MERESRCPSCVDFVEDLSPVFPHRLLIKPSSENPGALELLEARGRVRRLEVDLGAVREDEGRWLSTEPGAWRHVAFDSVSHDEPERLMVESNCPGEVRSGIFFFRVGVVASCVASQEM